MLALTNMPLIGFRVNMPEGKTVPLCSRAGIPLPSALMGGDAQAVGRDRQHLTPFKPWECVGLPQESSPVQPGSSSVAGGGLGTPAMLPSCRSWQRAVLGGQDCFPSLSS